MERLHLTLITAPTFGLGLGLLTALLYAGTGDWDQMATGLILSMASDHIAAWIVAGVNGVLSLIAGLSYGGARAMKKDQQKAEPPKRRLKAKHLHGATVVLAILPVVSFAQAVYTLLV